MDILSMCIGPACVGVFIGIFSGMLGIGGGTIMVPVFRLAFGLSALSATATSLFAIIPTSASGAVSHIRAKTCVPALGIAAGVGGACTSPIGVWVATVSPAWLVMLAAALIIAYSAINMFRKAFATNKASDQVFDARQRAEMGKHMQSSDALATQHVLSTTTNTCRTLSAKELCYGVLIGLLAGVASGYIGVGGGFIMVPLFVVVIGIPMKLASGTSLIAVMILAIPGTIEQGMLGNISYLAGLAVVIGSIPGAIIGARLLRVVPERGLRLLFGAFLIVAAVMLVINEFGTLG